MPDIQWEKRFEVGHERIDFEHRIFLGLIQNLDKDSKSGCDTEKIKRTLTEILRYAEFHFLSEENIMIDVGYPEYENHQTMHLDLTKDLLENLREYGQGTRDISTIIAFLYNWFVNHTVHEDIEIARFIQQE